MAKKPVVDSVSKACKHSGLKHQNLRNGSPSNQEVAKREKNLQCPNCGKCYFHEKKYRRHLCSHLNYHPYECDVCLKCFSLKNLLQTHKELHANDSKSYSCPDCPKRFSYLSALNRHRLYHLESPPYPCPICRAKFNSISTRSMHIKNHVVTCILCKMDFQNFSQLMFHIAKVHRSSDTADDKPNKRTDVEMMDSKDNELEDSELKFTCFVCEQCFSSEQLMTSHLKAHRIVMCSHCPQFFPDKYAFYDHEFQHTGKHPFKCDACQSIFRSSESLLYHKKECKMGALSIQNSSDVHIMNTISDAVDISNEVQAKVENAIKTVLSANTTTRESFNDCNTLEKLQREVEHNILGLGSSDNLTVARNMLNETVLSTQHLDDCVTPSLDFNDHLHFHWLVCFMKKLKHVSYPLALDLLKKVLHIEKLINLECAQASGAVCNKINFLYLMCVQKELSLVRERNMHTLYAQI